MRDVSLFGCGSTMAVIGVNTVVPSDQDIIALFEPLGDQGG